MRLPNRKPGKYTFPKFDPNMTAEKLQALKDKLEHIKKYSLPQAIRETKQYAENGDFSENAEYQIAKSRLRGLNKAVDEIQYQIGHAIVIESPQDTSRVRLGHTVTVHVAGIQKSFQILGPTETNPEKGIISFASPLGTLLLDRAVGDVVTMRVGEKDVHYEIVSINV